MSGTTWKYRAWQVARQQWEALQNGRFEGAPQPAEPTSPGPAWPQLDVRTILVFVCAAVSLTLVEYWGTSNKFLVWALPLGLVLDDPRGLLEAVFRQGEYARLARLGYWSGMTALCYLALPAVFVWTVLRGRLRDFGLGFSGSTAHMGIYVALYLAVIPFVFAVSRTASFQATYPFYEFAHRSLTDFVLWQLVYGLQFLSLEFFFRGFLIHGLKSRLGAYAVLVSMIPYCMIHFGKPMPETLGAIVAGLALGWLSLATRSIWLGVAIHISVAVSMDIFALVAKGKL